MGLLGGSRVETARVVEVVGRKGAHGDAMCASAHPSSRAARSFVTNHDRVVLQSLDMTHFLSTSHL